MSMPTVQGLGSDVLYLKNLVTAGWGGITSAHHEVSGRLSAPASPTAMWAPAAICGALGMLGTRAIGKRRSASVALGGLAGTALGLGAAAAWASRHFAVAAGRRAARQVNFVRDTRWLERNPIDYA
jgi:hypothetical protein